MNVAELQQLANDRLSDAQALLSLGRRSGAYYLAGYAIECGLKACVLGHVTRTGVIFTDRKYAERCWTHEVGDLLKLAFLETSLGMDIASNPALGLNSTAVTDWTEVSRYHQKTQTEAQRLVDAVGDAANGILPWIRRHW